MTMESEQTREREILEARARALAATSASEDVGRVELTIAIVEAGGERIGIPCDGVREIVRCPRITRLPGAPAWCRGLVQIRGEAMTAVDLAAFLDLRAGEAARFVVTVSVGQRAAALLVDEVVGLREVREDGLAESLHQREASGQRAIRTTTKDLVGVLDVNVVLSLLQVGGTGHGDAAAPMLER